MRDQFSQIRKAVAARAVARTQSPPAHLPLIIDCLGFQSLVFDIVTGQGGITFTPTNRIDWVILHSDDADGGWAPVPAADVQLEGGETWAAGGIVRSHTAAHGESSSRKVGYIGNKRFVQMIPTYGGTHAQPTITFAMANLGHPLVAPV